MAGRLFAPVDTVYPIDEIKDALAHADRGGRNGKILVNRVRGGAPLKNCSYTRSNAASPVAACVRGKAKCSSERRRLRTARR